MAKVIVFGKGRVAGLAHFYLANDSEHEVVAFTVDPDHVTEASFHDLPLVPFDTVTERYPPDEYSMFVAVGYGRMNKFRQARYEEAKAKGYKLVSYISTRASIWPGAEIGDNCFIMEYNAVQPFTRIGNDVTMWGGSHVGHESVIGDHCFISSHVVISGMVTVGENCFIGVNATIRDEVTIARECVIGAGVVIRKDTDERQVYAAPRPELLAITSDRLPSV